MTKFVDDLPGGRGVRACGDLSGFAADLRAHPGRWAEAEWANALAPSSRHAAAHRINGGLRTAYPELRTGFEATVRKGVLYVRYVGDHA